MLEWLGMSGDLAVTVTSSRPEQHVPVRIAGRTVSLRELLTRDLNIHSIPRRYFFELLGHFADAEHEVRLQGRRREMKRD